MKLCYKCGQARPHGHAFLSPTNPTGCAACRMAEHDAEAAAADEVRRAWMAAVDRRLQAMQDQLDALGAF